MCGEVSGSHYVEHRQIVNETTLYVAARDQGDAGRLEATPFSLKLEIVSEKMKEKRAILRWRFSCMCMFGWVV